MYIRTSTYICIYICKFDASLCYIVCYVVRMRAAAGGEATWRNYLTLPNILKEFNPGLKGYSVGKGEFLAPNSHMNVAFPVSADFDAYRQAQFLVKKMKKDPDVDFKNDWKVNNARFPHRNNNSDNILCSRIYMRVQTV